MTDFVALSRERQRAVIVQELRRLLSGTAGSRLALPFGLPAIDAVLPDGGLPCGALHEVVPESDAALPTAFGFMFALLAYVASQETLPRSSSSAGLPRPDKGRCLPLIFILPAFGRRAHGRLHGHGLNALGLDPALAILVETAHRKDTLWALAEALHSGAPRAVAGMIDRLDLKTSQKLHLAASDAGLPLLLIRPAQNLESSAAATRWRIGTAEAARDRFGFFARPRWRLRLERCRNGRPGEWVVEYDHVAHRFSLATALAGPAISRRPSDRSAPGQATGQATGQAIRHAG